MFTIKSLMFGPERTAQIKLRETFVQNLNGTSKEEIIFLAPFPYLFIFISVFIKCWILRSTKLNLCYINELGQIKVSSVTNFLLEFLTIVVPLVLQLTLFADAAFEGLLFTSLFTFFIIIFSVSSLNNNNYWRTPDFTSWFLCNTMPTNNTVCITYFRTFIFLLTSISILAVDFQIYPRRFAKAENYGVSLMDLGVGLYVMASGVVSKEKFAIRKFKDNFFESLPLLCFGVIRCVIMQQIDYQKHITEYGTHWNFFITLGLVKMMANIILKLFNNHSLICAIVLLMIHEFLLTWSLEQYVMMDLPRDNLIKANREGIVSLLGYLCIYIIGISTKRLIGNVDRKRGQSVKTKLHSMIVFSVVFSMLYLTLKFTEPIIKVSRRLANTPYILWTTTVCFEYLILGLVLELAFLLFLPKSTTSSSCNVFNLLLPDLCKAINNNALLFFLVSNLSTGFINMYFDVLNFETWRSMLMLLLYMLFNCSVVYTLKLGNIKIKLY
ncbi:uncharacterized protein LOC129000412 [Macrosteles quadrilineatus]|uniref:uncharacterized protein LOC129000412 n=1 Tax=Macrosteles quadrilineatus TaxID=74068 RepID=UPI0023E1469A|nr:uncharacterized protein LOC129000412 [Macrosteles quadrilineatus]